LQLEPEQKPRNILPDCIIPILALAFTVYYLTTITEVPWISQASAFVVSGLLLLSIIAFIIRSAWRIRQHQETLRVEGAFRELLGDMPINLKRISLLLLAIAYVWFIDGLGFTLTTFIFVFSGIILLSSLANWKNALMISLSCSVIGYIVFIYFFKTRFPAGPIEHWLKAVL
jgi:hypothetical protein